MATIAMDSPFGTLGIAASSRGVVEVDLGGVVAKHGAEDDPAAREILDQAVQQFSEYFAGERKEIEVPIDPDVEKMLAGDSFRARALTALREIPYGEVVSYGELAERAGSPRAARAAGTACATNPLAIIVPCHRVVPAGGGIGSYGGGEDMKRELLALEGSLAELWRPQGQPETS